MRAGNPIIATFPPSIVVANTPNEALTHMTQAKMLRASSSRGILTTFCIKVIRTAHTMSGKLLQPRMVMLQVRAIFALSSLAFRVTTTLPTMVVITTVLKIVESWSVSLELSVLKGQKSRGLKESLHSVHESEQEWTPQIILLELACFFFLILTKEGDFDFFPNAEQVSFLHKGLTQFLYPSKIRKIATYDSFHYGFVQSSRSIELLLQILLRFTFRAKPIFRGT